MHDERKAHWEKVYREKAEDEVSWFIADPETSLSLVESTGLSPADPIIDVGGGASHLVDHLLARGYSDLTVLDISPTALETARRRLGADADKVRWLEADVCALECDGRWRLWHDRAVFHFLVKAEDRRAYLDSLARHLDPDGHVIVATFSFEGPRECSGLPVEQYDADKLLATFGPGFELLNLLEEIHVTPAGKEQAFNYFHLRRQG